MKIHLFEGIIARDQSSQSLSSFQTQLTVKVRRQLTIMALLYQRFILLSFNR